MSGPMPSSSTFPLVRSFPVRDVGAQGTEVTIEATPDEARALAALNGLVGIGSLRATLRLRREGTAGVHLTGDVQARVTQTCVVTLEPFDADIAEPVDFHYLPAADIVAAYPGGSDRTVVDETEPEPPEPIVNGRIDLGAVASEVLALSLDPYPRRPGVEFKPMEENEPDVSPFAGLAKLKPNPSH